MRHIQVLLAFTFVGMVIATHAKAVTVHIDGGPNGWGCTTCFGGPPSVYNPPFSFPGGRGAVVTLVNQGEPGPLQVTLPAGTYSITNAAATGNYSAWNFNTSNGGWVWSFVIASDNGNNTANVLKVGWVDVNAPTQAAAAGATNVASHSFGNVLNPSTSVAAFFDTFSLATTTTLDFFIIDGFLPDNLGGVALNIDPVGVPGPIAGAGLVAFSPGADAVRDRLSTARVAVRCTLWAARRLTMHR